MTINEIAGNMAMDIVMIVVGVVVAFAALKMYGKQKEEQDKKAAPAGKDQKNKKKIKKK